MQNKNREYLAIDLKSFYASVECVERGLDPMLTNLVVADPERGEGTICLAITPAMKRLGVKNRCRVYQIPKNIKYIIAEPRMQLYIDYSSSIYRIYQKYVSKDDIHVYSIDECFIDVTDYLKMYGMSAKDLGIVITDDIFKHTGITATCGIGSNLYLAKVAMDIIAKHSHDNIGVLDEDSYRRLLWHHRPLTDFWRIGRGTSDRLKKYGLTTMEDIAKADTSLLYRVFGKDAEILIDHAWGREATTMMDIKNYKPKGNSLSSGQVLLRDYDYEEAGIVVKEMAEQLCLELVKKNLYTDRLSLGVGYSHLYAQSPTGGYANLPTATSSAYIIRSSLFEIFCKTVKRDIPIRRIDICFDSVFDNSFSQATLFMDVDNMEKERKIQKAVIEIRERFGSNAILKGTDLQKGATAIERNMQIGGHKSGL